MSVIPHRTLPAWQFYDEHLATNQPVVLRGLTDDWPARAEWRNPHYHHDWRADDDGVGDGDEDQVNDAVFERCTSVDALLSVLHSLVQRSRRRSLTTVNGSRINLLHLASLSPHSTPPIADCATPSHERSCNTSTQQFFTQWHADPMSVNDRYLKDWHLMLEREDMHFYTVPEHFAEDFMNEYWLRHIENDDYRFVYVSRAGGWTGCHRDVFRSYSWSANVVGTKLWLLISPEASQRLMDDSDDFPIFDCLTEASQSLLRQQVSDSEVRVTFQHEGEILFVPSGWFHQVWNCTDCVSLNHNWNNGYNVCAMLAMIIDEERMALECLRDYLRAAISFQPSFITTKSNNDVNGGMELDVSSDAVQRMVLANAGINREGFQQFLEFIRLSQQQKFEHALQTLGECSSDAAERKQRLQQMLEYHRMTLRVIDELQQRANTLAVFEYSRSQCS